MFESKLEFTTTCPKEEFGKSSPITHVHYILTRESAMQSDVYVQTMWSDDVVDRFGMAHARQSSLQRELGESQGMGVVSNSWLDRGFTLNSLHVQTLMLTHAQTGTPFGSL